jgi:Na+-transporting NADH:ubiquinone oxidoreductase subunit B
MRRLRRIINKIKPHFQKGGKFEKLQSTFDAFETFLFVPDKVSVSGTHIRDSIDLKRTMSIVVFALLPAMLFGMWNTGYQSYGAMGLSGTTFEIFWFGFLKVFPIIIVSYVTGLGIEFISAQIRGHEVNEGFLVTGILIPLIMPVTIPLWIVAVATAFAVILGKEIFGGTGMNIFNPALLARAFVFFAYPAQITGDYVWVYTKNAVDGFSGATPISFCDAGTFSKIPDNLTLFLGYIPGSIGETSKLAILIGAAILLISGIGSWRIMLTTVLGGIVMSLIFNAFAVNDFMRLSPLTQLLMGGFLFGAVFMATDPVSAAQTNKGKLIYGFLIGLFGIMIRVFNPAYPEGMMLAILLMNAFAPLIDHYVVEANIKRRLKRALIKISN